MCIIVYNSQTVEITRMAIKKLIVTVLESCCQYACTLNMLHFPTAPPSHLLATRCSSCSSGFCHTQSDINIPSSANFSLKKFLSKKKYNNLS